MDFHLRPQWRWATPLSESSSFELYWPRRVATSVAVIRVVRQARSSSPSKVSSILFNEISFIIIPHDHQKFLIKEKDCSTFTPENPVCCSLDCCSLVSGLAKQPVVKLSQIVLGCRGAWWNARFPGEASRCLLDLLSPADMFCSRAQLLLTEL